MDKLIPSVGMSALNRTLAELAFIKENYSLEATANIREELKEAYNTCSEMQFFGLVLEKLKIMEENYPFQLSSDMRGEQVSITLGENMFLERAGISEKARIESRLTSLFRRKNLPPALLEI